MTRDWTLIIPLKALPGAKTRLAAGLDRAQHAQLVQAIRDDTLVTAAAVGRVLVVVDRVAADSTSEPSPVTRRLVQIGVGLNAAIREGAAEAARSWPGGPIAALVGDLPALRREELEEALTLALQYPRAFVADKSGRGTTLLTAAPGIDLQPAFGIDSAARHARIAQLLAVGPGLQLDVDTAADLREALELGVGPATQAVLTGP